MFAASVSLALRRSAAHRSAAFLLPSASSAAWSSAAGPSLRAQQQLSRIFPSLAISRSAPAPRWPILLRAFSMSPTLATPRPGLLRRKHLGRIPHLAKASGPKTHTGAKKRFKSYKNGTFKHVKAGTNQLKRKDNAIKRGESNIMIFTGKAQTAKLKRLMPFWRRTRRNGGW